MWLKCANSDDLPYLQHISTQTFREAYAEQNTAENMETYISKHFSAVQLRTEIENPASVFYLAYANEALVGYLKVNFAPAQTELNDPESLEIERIYVLKTHYGNKVGAFLYQKAHEIAQKQDLKYIWLGVWEHNPRAIRFYEKMGFTPFGTHVFDFNGDAQTDILMRIFLK